jgi:diguanylate cyclase (GGDEF)-like protein
MPDQQSTSEFVDLQRLRQIQASLKKLEQRDWWLWIVAMAVMLLLTLAIFSLSFPGLLTFQDATFQLSLKEAARGIIGLVVLFNVYTIYQQVSIKRLRRQLAEQLDATSRMCVRAEELQQQATIDPLTGLYNRRVAEKQLAAEAARSQRHGHLLAVISFDLNNFKLINDNYGHAAGDEALREFAKRLKAAIRGSDLAARMGGDEFLAIMPECPTDRIQAILDRLRSVTINYQNTKIPVEFSAGWVGYRQGESPEQFLERADQLLYAEKRAQQHTESNVSVSAGTPA